MNEIPSILESREKIIWDGKPEYAPYITSVIIGSLVLFLFAFAFGSGFMGSIILGISLGIILLIGAFIIGNLSYKFTHYGLTNRRAIFQSGIFGRSFKSVNYDDIKNSSLSVGFFNWIFGTGSVQVFTGEMQSTGGKNSQIVPKYDTFAYIRDSNEILKKLQAHTTTMEEEMYGGKNVVQRVKLTK